MVRLRGWPKGALAPFGLSAVVFVLAPTPVGYQDLAALIARQPTVTARWRDHLIASPFGTIHAATFSFPRPVGTAIPASSGYSLASLDPRGLDFTNAKPEPPLVDPGALPPPLKFPRVNRALKGDPLVLPLPTKALPDTQPKPANAPGPQWQPSARPKVATNLPPPASENPLLAVGKHDEPIATPEPVTDAAIPVADAAMPAEPTSPQGAAADATATAHDFPLHGEPFIDKDLSLALKAQPPLPALDPYAQTKIGKTPSVAPGPQRADDARQPQTTALYFGVDAPFADAMKPWEPGERPILKQAAVDPDIKQSALEPESAPRKSGEENEKEDVGEKGGKTVAPKGVVTGKDKRPHSPAERLKLTEKERAKAEKCLTEAIYFESRGEPLRGQMAVAQVVINRVFTDFYPKTVCGVVYQNSDRKLACQFTFACDNVADVVREPDMWAQAKRIAKDALDGHIWVPEVGKATHYHAYWVRPWWVRTMNKLHRLGVHTFYRPRAWGDGSDIPDWGQTTTPDEMKRISAAAKSL